MKWLRHGDGRWRLTVRDDFAVICEAREWGSVCWYAYAQRDFRTTLNHRFDDNVDFQTVKRCCELNIRVESAPMATDG